MVLALRPVIAAETDTALEPAPGAGLQGAVLPDGSEVPYSKVQLLTSLPLGLTFPFSVAVVWVIELAGSVSTPGAMITSAAVLNSPSASLGPPALVAASLKR